MDSIARLEGVTKSFVLDGVVVPGLRDVSLTVPPGEFLAIVGPSGSGKSTLMHLLGCLDLPDEGHCAMFGHDVTGVDSDTLAGLRNSEIGFVFQSFNLLPRTTALDNVATPLIYAGIARREAQDRALALLERLGLSDRMGHRPNQLSGGQQQRVAIARALINQPSLVLADEPTGNLDTETSDEVLRLLRDLNREDGLTVILITHEPKMARLAHRTLALRDGRLAPA